MRAFTPWCIAIVMFGLPTLTCNQDGSALIFSSAHLDLGTLVADGTQYKSNLSVSNKTNESFQLIAQWDCGCTRVEPAQLRLAPYSTASVCVSVTPSERSNQLNSTVYFKDVETDKVVKTVSIRAQVAPFLAANLQTVQISCQELSGTVERQIEVRNLRPARFDGVLAMSENLVGEVQVANKVSIGSFSKAVIVLRSTYSGGGRSRGFLRISRAGDSRPVLSLPVVRTGVPAISAEPPTLLLSDSNPTGTVTLSASDGRAFKITDVDTGVGLPVEANWTQVSTEQQELSLHLLPGRIPRFKGEVVVTALLEQKEIKIRMPVLGTNPA